jgi:hypothetical protein
MFRLVLGRLLIGQLAASVVRMLGKTDQIFVGCAVPVL